MKAVMEYNESNLNRVIEFIKGNLSPDLLPKKWIERNKKNPMFGHCHTASATLQKIFGTKSLKLYRALDDENIWHWWCVDVNGKIIDITADQYYSENRIPPHDRGERASMLGFDYRTRVLTLHQRVLEKLEN